MRGRGTPILPSPPHNPTIVYVAPIQSATQWFVPTMAHGNAGRPGVPTIAFPGCHPSHDALHVDSTVLGGGRSSPR